jgi:N-acetylmuramoyl-L-alanine amidase
MTARMKRLFPFFYLVLLLLADPALSLEKGMTIRAVRSFSYTAFTRIVFELDAAGPYVLTRSADGRSLLLSSYDGPCTLKSALPQVHDGVIAGVESREEAGKLFIVIRLDAAAGEVKDFVLRAPDRIVLDVQKGPALPSPALTEASVLIVLDPGHGGRDTGVVEAQVEEKTLNIDLAQAVKKALQKNQRLKVMLTRDRDIGVTLDERAASTNAAGAVLFISLHAGPGRDSRVYIQDPEEDSGLQASRPENRDFLAYETGSEQQEKLWGRQQASHARDSGVLGRILARELSGNAEAEPVQAPLAGLRAVDAAAVLVEIGMAQDRTRAAELIAKGIEQYVSGNR